MRVRWVELHHEDDGDLPPAHARIEVRVESIDLTNATNLTKAVRGAVEHFINGARAADAIQAEQADRAAIVQKRGRT